MTTTRTRLPAIEVLEEQLARYNRQIEQMYRSRIINSPSAFTAEQAAEALGTIDDLAELRAQTLRQINRWAAVEARYQQMALDFGGTQAGRVTPDPSTVPPPGKLTTVKLIREQLMISGAYRWMEKIRETGDPVLAQSLAVQTISGSVSSSIFSAGNGAAQKLITKSKTVEGYIRVTGAKPCEFCAMLSSRGPVYKVSDFKTHNHCSCVMVPVYKKDLPRAEWPGRSSEFRTLWDETMRSNRLSPSVPGMGASEHSRKTFNKAFRQYEKFLPDTFANPAWINGATSPLKGQAKRLGTSYLRNVAHQSYKAAGISILDVANVDKLIHEFKASLKKTMANEVRVLAGHPSNQVVNVLASSVLTGTTQGVANKLVSSTGSAVAKQIARQTGLKNVSSRAVNSALNHQIVHRAVLRGVRANQVYEALTSVRVRTALAHASREAFELVKISHPNLDISKLSQKALNELVSDPRMVKALDSVVSTLVTEITNPVTKNTRTYVQNQVTQEAARVAAQFTN